LNQSHLIIRNSPLVFECVKEITSCWLDVIYGDHPNYEPIERIFIDSARWGDDYAQIVRHRETDILFEVSYREADGDFGEHELHSVTAVVVIPQQRITYDVEDANGNTLHQYVANDRLKEFV